MADITDAAMLVLYREALQAIATGQSYSINDRRLTRANLSEVMKIIEWLERRINSASDTSGGTLLVNFRDQI